MGTQMNLPPRSYEIVPTGQLDAYLTDIAALAKKHGMTVADVLAAAAVLQAERRNNLYVANGEIFDEQISALGNMLYDIAAAIRGTHPGK